MNGKRILAALMVMGLIASAASGQTIDPTIEKSKMYGIRLPTGRLWTYDFTTSTRAYVDYVRNVETGAVMTGFRGAAYFKSQPPNHPGFQQIHAFWLDPADNQTKLVHIDVETAEARLTGISLGGGEVRGATAVVGDTTVTNPDGSTTTVKTWRVFALQDRPEPQYPKAVDGMANINPNNRDDYEFNMTTPSKNYTRNDLHKDAAVDEQGVLYQGPASYVRFKPKGNGNQNSMILNGEPFLLSNAKLYEFEGDLTVRVFNDHIKNTKAMGHWWIGIDAQTATVKEDGVVLVSPPEPWTPTSRLVSLHTETGLATTVMELSQVYKGLATNDNGATFYTVNGGDLYRVNPSTKTETKVGSMSLTDVGSLDFVGSTLFAFDRSPNRLYPIDSTTGSKIGSGAYLSVTDIGTMNFMPADEVPVKSFAAFD